jgi:hypothetical protein
MNRRDFLHLKTERGIQTIEISCQRLHMLSLERRVTGGGSEEDFDPAEGREPPTAFAERTTEQLFGKLRRDLDGVDRVRVVGPQWLSGADEELNREFDALLVWFRARGGRVEFS